MTKTITINFQEFHYYERERERVDRLNTAAMTPAQKPKKEKWFMRAIT